MNERLKQQIAILINNTVRLMCFTALAVAFNKWWIVFFTLIFWTSTETDKKNKGAESDERVGTL